MDFGIIYKSDTTIRLEGYTYIDWAGSKANRRSTFGFVLFLGSGVISWRKEAMDSRNVEYRGTVVPACVVVW